MKALSVTFCGTVTGMVGTGSIGIIFAWDVSGEAFVGNAEED